MDNQQFTIVSGLIVKYIMNTITPDEKEYLEAWVSESRENSNTFHTIISSENLYSKIDLYSDKKYLAAYNEFLSAKSMRTQKAISFRKVMKYVAVLILITTPLSGIYFWGENSKNELRRTRVTQEYSVPILKLSNGKVIMFDSESSIDEITENNQSISLKNNKIEYPNEVANDNVLSYNELIVPNRYRQKIVLSDKSVVWVNSNSSIRYPLLFGSKERRVYITGEALFEVTKDTLRPFIVETEGVSINVTGTLFNITAYGEQSNSIVTLVNGRVTTFSDNKSYILSPNQQLIFDKESEYVEMREVIASDYTKWVDGLYVFDKVKLKDILLLIERSYSITCNLENKEYMDMEITGQLDVNKGVMNFIEMLSKCSDFKFSLTEESITII